MLLPLGDPQLADPFLPPLPRRRAIAAMQECDPRGEERLNLFLLAILAWIIDTIVVRLVGCLEDRPTSP